MDDGPDAAGAGRSVAIVDVEPTDERVSAAHAAYFSELERRFPTGFDPGDTTAELPRYRPPTGACVLALLDGRTVGTAALAPLPTRGADDDAVLPVGEVKRMWVATGARGSGLGRRLLAAVEQRARTAGYATLRLDTNEVLDAALRLYAAAGYVHIERYNDNPYATHFLQRRLR